MKPLDKSPTSKIGILGGTFDPIHNGHIGPAREAFKKFNLDKILVIPTHTPPHKNGPTASAKERINMVKLVCDNEKAFTLDTREINRANLSYTVDTIKELKAQYPTSELFFIMGMDSLLTFTQWYLWQEILLHCHLIVNKRPGYDLSKINIETKKLLATYKIDSKYIKKSGCIFLNNSKELNISSTEIRQKISRNLDCSQWLSNEIIQYIGTEKLYR